ncbi:MAG TPA: PTS sugar transporter subunit IIA [Lactovum miscens]|uniref:BglG family transcription antiterminator n=1 Tax=Lactovum miscens TaxID=190387 RepID=UPI002ED7F4AB
MKKIEIFFEYLKKQPIGKFISSAKLAEILSVTDRTIRNYVMQTNKYYPDLIETDRNGYRFNHEKDVSREKINVSAVDGRRFSLLRLLLQKGEEGVDLFDIAEELKVSEATIRSDMSFLQVLAQNYQLVIRQHDFFYFIRGEDKDKRALIASMIRKSSNSTLSLECEMQKFLGEISLVKLKDYCKKIFSRFGFKTNKYFEQNFILHLIILLNQKDTLEISNFKSPSLEMINEISSWIYKNYGLEISQKGKYELALLCDGELSHNKAEVDSYVEQEISAVLNQALKELSDVFLIDFTDQLFLTRLLLHMQNLYNRIKENKVKRNLSAINIKMQYPVLFDMAVYLSSIIARDLKIKIAEDEIAFLALHIGSFLVEQKNNSNKIRTFLSVSNYLDHIDKMKNLIENRFGDEILIVPNNENIELEISIEESSIRNAEQVKVHEFLNGRDFDMIQNGIKHVKQQRYLQFLEGLLPKLIQEDANLELESSLSKTEAFRKIGDWFISHSYTEEDYSEKLLEREQMSPTTFASGVSIPHAIKYETKKTGLLIIRPKDEFFWDEHKVILVIALAVSSGDSFDFNRIFPRMVECLVDEYHVKYLKESRSQTEFIQRLIAMMTADGYYE